MKYQRPTIPRGTRDFGPVEMAKRNFIFSTIKTVFQKFGYQPLETPGMESLSVLMGKYGHEGDQLLFKILNSGDFLKAMSAKDLKDGYRQILRKVSEKGLRYDLTVPFARYVAMNHHKLVFPFKRYQIQPVWRADRPQKGRYREFYQCDADVVGTRSMINEAEIIWMIYEIFSNLGIKSYTIKINHRKILEALSALAGGEGKENTFYIAIDKLEKAGKEKVIRELTDAGFDHEKIDKVFPLLEMAGDTREKIIRLKKLFHSLESGISGLQEIEETFSHIQDSEINIPNLRFDLSLARGLSYYTGSIFEVTMDDGSIGSLSGGGRYDNLTSLYGVPDIPGVGFSLGVDRIYDVMEKRDLFPDQTSTFTIVLMTTLDAEAVPYSLPLLAKLRSQGISAEIYPDVVKIKKQLNYADRKGIPYVILIGSQEMETGKLTLKSMRTGKQEALDIGAIIEKIKNQMND